MKLQVFAIFDSAACVYDRPICFRADGEALRFWKHMVLNQESPVSKSPKDFSFYKIGEYDDNTAEITPLDRFCVQTAEEVVAESRRIEEGSLRSVEIEEEEARINSAGGTA